MDKIRVGIVGVGTQGRFYLEMLNDSAGGIVVAVCDTDDERIAALKRDGLIRGEHAVFNDYKEMMDQGGCDCVVIVTPHPSHLEIAEYAFMKRLHVMCDKPITIAVSEADTMISRWNALAGVKFATMYTMRSSPVNRVIRDLLNNGSIGGIYRVDMICTEWLRTQKYYLDQPWRGTWQEEGAGLLLNQAPHNLDLLYWWFGPARAISAKVATRFHAIETEDEVNATIYSKAGFPIRFYANTGEAPGRDHVEIVGDKGTLVRENGQVRLCRLSEPLGNLIGNSPEHAPRPSFEWINIDIPDAPRGHKVLFENFFDAIRRDLAPAEMIAPGSEAIHSVEWANAMLYSSVAGKEVALPLDRNEYDHLLDDLRKGRRSIHDGTA